MATKIQGRVAPPCTCSYHSCPLRFYGEKKKTSIAFSFWGDSETRISLNYISPWNPLSVDSIWQLGMNTNNIFLPNPCITLVTNFPHIASVELEYCTHIRHYCGFALPPSKGVHLLVFHTVTFSLKKKHIVLELATCMVINPPPTAPHPCRYSPAIYNIKVRETKIVTALRTKKIS